MATEFDHATNRQTLDSPRKVMPILFDRGWPASILDVGCGTATWLHMGRGFGVEDVLGVDGVAMTADRLLIPAHLFRVVDLRAPWSLERKFDVALCLEVAEHLDARAGMLLVETLTAHADEIVFSAACPGQPGQHHINCQWPAYWQQIFNRLGFTCSDAIRWKVWDDRDVDVWYRQNMFVATRDAQAGTEKRLKAVIHPDFLPHLVFAEAASVATQRVKSVEDGAMPVAWYANSAVRAMVAKLRRRFLPA